MNEELKHEIEGGAKSQAPAALCVSCNQFIDEKQNFCHHCGHPVAKMSVTASKKPAKKSKKVFDILKNALVLALAIFLMAAAFLPLIKMEIEYEDEKLAVKFNTVDAVALFVNSLYRLDDEELEEFMEDVEESVEEYYEDWQDGRKLGEFSRMVKKVAKLSLRSQDRKTTAGMVLVAVLSLLQIITAVLLLICAAFSFVGVFARSFRNTSFLSFMLLGLNIALMVSNAFAIKIAFGFNSSMVKFTAVSLLACIFFLAVAVLFVVCRICVLKNKIAVGEIVKRSLCVSFALVMLLGVLAPILKVEIKQIFSGATSAKHVTTSLDASLYCEFDLSEREKQTMEELNDDGSIGERIEENFYLFQGYIKRDFEKGEANVLTQSIYADLLLGYGLYDHAGIFEIGTVASIVACLLALLILFQNLVELSIGKRMSSALLLSLKITAVVMAVAMLALVIVMTVVVNYNASVLHLAYESKVAYGTILALIGAIGTLSVPGVKKM